MEERFWRFGMAAPVIRDVHLLERQLSEIGVTTGDIGCVVLSHLQYDHCGCLKQFRHAQVCVQRREHAHAFSPEPGTAYFPDEYNVAGLQWRLLDGDWELMPGVRFIQTRGHTIGHQSAIVELPRSGTVILPFDVGDLQENFYREVLPGESCDDAAALESIRRINVLTAQLGAMLLLFHDPIAIQTVRLSPNCYC